MSLGYFQHALQKFIMEMEFCARHYYIQAWTKQHVGNIPRGFSRIEHVKWTTRPDRRRFIIVSH